MYYETEKNNHGLRHNPLKACVVPRPIGWITSMNAAGVVNLAPFSFFNVLSYDPPFVLFSAGAQDGGGITKNFQKLPDPDRADPFDHVQCDERLLGVHGIQITLLPRRGKNRPWGRKS